MPMTDFQRRVLRLLADSRTEESYFADGSFLNFDGPRFSDDFDIFYDKASALEEASDRDAAILRGAGVSFRWGKRTAGKHDAVASDGKESFALEWVVDSDFRFFPIRRDDDFGFALHPVDAATNKILAVIGREEPRDVVDAMFAHHRILPLGALLWAAAGKDPGWTPLEILSEVRRTARWRDEDYESLRLSKPIGAREIGFFLKSAGSQAESWISRMPASQVGAVYLDASGKPVQPDPSDLTNHTAHFGARGGHWPSNGILMSDMLRRGREEDEPR